MRNLWKVKRRLFRKALESFFFLSLVSKAFPGNHFASTPEIYANNQRNWLLELPILRLEQKVILPTIVPAKNSILTNFSINLPPLPPRTPLPRFFFNFSFRSFNFLSHPFPLNNIAWKRNRNKRKIFHICI